MLSAVNMLSSRSDYIKYHLHYSAEYRPDRLRKLVNDGTILGYLTELDRSVTEILERQVEKWNATTLCISVRLRPLNGSSIPKTSALEFRSFNTFKRMFSPPDIVEVG